MLWQLDAVRGAAACYVAAGHLWRPSLDAIKPGLGYFLSFGQEVVITFFLLSGFVIHWSVAQKPDLTFRRYLRDRALRIYPLFLLTMLLALGVGHLHASADARSSWQTLLGNIFMLQDWGAIKPGVWVDVFAGVLVLWSLSYEWWFYMLYFPIRKFIGARQQVWLVAGVSIIAALIYLMQPNQACRFLMYFCIWWTGVELARAKLAQQPLTLVTFRKSFAALLVISAILACAVWQRAQTGEPMLFGVHPWLEFRHFFAALVILIAALSWHKLHWLGFRKLLGGFVTVAPWSYALYLLHEPLSELFFPSQYSYSPWLKISVSTMIAVTAAWAAEKYFQTWCRRLFRK